MRSEDTRAGRVSKCECGASIRWARTDTSSMPLEADPDPNLGNVQLLERGGHHYAVVFGKKTQAAAMRKSGIPMYVAHFMHCPAASQYRRNANRRSA